MDDHEADSLFHPFTQETLFNIERRMAEERASQSAHRSSDSDEEDSEASRTEKEAPKPNKKLEAGKKLPPSLDDFPKEMVGKPLEDLDEFYHNQMTFCVIGRDKTIYRFSASKALFVFTPFHPVRRIALVILVHPLFVILTIIVNCVFMTQQNEALSEKSESIFTAIYTTEMAIKVLARGFITNKFTYMRDPWNWLDFGVIFLAYFTWIIPMGKLTVLRTFRVFRALKTVAVIPGLKTIVGALLEAVRRLRDVMILTVFMLSIFALVGLQLYMGVLKSKCLRDYPPELGNLTDIEWGEYTENETNWYWKGIEPVVCGNGTGAGYVYNPGRFFKFWISFREYPKRKPLQNKLILACPIGYSCIDNIGGNPNYDYTSFDNFGWALLCAFRLMTQDFWESLYQLVLRAMGPMHVMFFLLVIFLGSFYLLNLILAIVTMSYDEQQKQDRAEAEEEEAERKQEDERKETELVERIEHEVSEILVQQGVVKSPSNFSCGSLELYINVEKPDKGDEKERLSVNSETSTDHKRRVSISITNGRTKRASLSLPGSPFTPRRSTYSSQFSWKKPKHVIIGTPADHIPLVSPYLENLNLPYADDSAAVTPTSDDLCNLPQYLKKDLLLNGRRSSFASHHSRRSQSSHPAGGGGDGLSPSRRSSYASQNSHTSRTSRASRASRYSFHSPADPNKSKSSKFENLWNKSKAAHLLPEVIVDKTKLDDNESSSCELDDDTAKDKIYANDLANNPFLCRTPSTANLDPKDVVLLKELVEHVSGPRGSFLSEMSLRKEPLRDKMERLFCSWTCCPQFYKFQAYIKLFVTDAFVDLFITLCILINTLFMALEKHPMDTDLKKTLEDGNGFFTYVFTVEAILKITALNFIPYLRDGWNLFDFIIVLFSMLELVFQNLPGLSVLRTFRLLRVFKLAKSWPTLNMLISIVGRTVGALGNLTIVLGIVVFIFAVMGQQLFGSHYKEMYKDNMDDMPRWSFISFFHSFMIVFRVLCGEWIESMWDCMKAAKWPCVPFFLLTMIIGNLVVLNLFLALLLSAFGAESLQGIKKDEEPNKLAEAINRISKFFTWIKVKIIVCFKLRVSRKKKTGFGGTYVPPVGMCQTATTRVDIDGKEVVVVADGRVPLSNGKVCDSSSVLAGTTTNGGINSLAKPGEASASHVEEEKASSEAAQPPTTTTATTTTAATTTTIATRPTSQVSFKADVIGGPESPGSGSSSSLSSHETGSQAGKVDADGEPEINEVNVTYMRYPDNCFCNICRNNIACCIRAEESKFGLKFWEIRCHMYNLVEHKYFETFIIMMILASSLALAMEDIHLPQRPMLDSTLYYMDKCFTGIFIMEMGIKWLAFGWKKYFTNAWCWLDFIIVLIAITMLIAESFGMMNISAFKAMRTLRALRPLRAVSRWEGMKVVVNALIKAIPSIFHVALVCLVFWLIFGIMGVQMFGGKFYKCIDADGIKINASIVSNKSDCLLAGYTWNNSEVNFDNVLNAYLALFQVATFKGWIDIMNDAIDIVNFDMQPVRENCIYHYLYFVLFIMFGSFFTLNLFVGVIIDNFNQQKKKAGGSLEMFMSEDQKKYYKAMKRLSSKKPQKSIPRPKFIVARLCFDLITNQKFDIGIMIVILMNMFTMALEHFEQDELLTTTLEHINEVFISIFTLECVLKIVSLRLWYFKFPWNVFDFVVVVVSILALALSDFMTNYFVLSPTLLRVVRVFRVGRVLRLVKSAKGIRTLLFSLAVSLPALFNIGLLLFLVMFIYATFGMSFFMHVKHTAGLDDMFNFETFFSSVILLFQMSTSAGWDGVLNGLMNMHDCNPEKYISPTTNVSECGKPTLAKVYLATYLVISFLVVINMYIAVILENFSQAREDVQQGLTPDDFDMYYEKWEKYDPKATQYIPLYQLADFVDYLEDPLRLPKPNHFILVKLDIPICEGDVCNCVDILDALTKHYLGTTDPSAVGDIAPEKKCKVQLEVISSTLRRQKEHYAARIIQTSYRFYRQLQMLEATTGRSSSPRTSITPSSDQSGSTGRIDFETSSPENTTSPNGKPDSMDHDSGLNSTASGARVVILHPDSGAVA